MVTKRLLIDPVEDLGQCDVFLSILRRADVLQMLREEGPYTVLVPRDDAFRNLPAAELEELLKTTDVERLRAIAKNHILRKSLSISALREKPLVETVNSRKLAVGRRDTTLVIEKATISDSDIECSNGMVHVVDSVLLPPTRDLVQTLQASGFTVFAELLAKSDLVDTIRGDWQFTVFAPGDDVLNALPDGVLLHLRSAESKGDLSELLRKHICLGRVYVSDWDVSKPLKTFDGVEVRLKRDSTGVTVNDRRITKPDIGASNGIVQGVSKLLAEPKTPPKKERK